MHMATGRTTLQIALVGFFSLGQPALSQTFQPPRTPDGRPDLQGVWESPWLTPIERLPEASTTALDPAEASRVQEAALERLEFRSMNADGYRNEGNTLAIVRGEYRAAMVVDPPDGRLPYRPEARPRPFVLPTSADSYEAIGPNVRCVGGVGGAPLYYAPGASLRTIVQTPSHLMIHSEGINDTRVFGIGAAPRPEAMRSAYGDSVARWEGDTLVVETTHFSLPRNVRMAPGFTPLVFRDGAKMIERFKLIAEDELLYQFTVEDPSTFERPWLAEYSMMRSKQRQFEYACHEGNYAVTNILQGSRVQEKRAAKAD
jgi:hypothetical protein